MTINRHNYEKYLIDYLDGKLSPLQIAEVLTFLQKNPDIQDEFEGMQEAVVPNSAISYPHKFELKKNSFHKCGIDSEFEYLCIAHTEGDITKDEKLELDSILKENLKKIEELKLFEKAKASPNLSVVYEDKGKLKRTRITPYRQISYRLAISVAASAIIAVTIYSSVQFLKFTKQDGSLQKSENAQFAIIKKENEETHQGVKVVASTAKFEKPKSYQVATIRNTAIVKGIDEGMGKDVRIDSIPSQINRLEPKPIYVSEDLKQVQLAMNQRSLEISQPLTIAYKQPLKVEYNKEITTKEIGLFEIVQFGVKSLGKLIGRDVKLDAEKDKNGNIEKINFESQLFAFSTTVKNNEE